MPSIPRHFIISLALLGLSGCPNEVPAAAQFGTADAGSGQDAATLDGASAEDAQQGPDVADVAAEDSPIADVPAADVPAADVPPADVAVADAGPVDAPDATSDVPTEPVDAGCTASSCLASGPCQKATCQANGTCGEQSIADNTACGTGKSCHSGICLADPAKALAVVTGGNTTCAVLADTTVQCWGDAEFGQLGNGLSGSGKNSATPVQVKGVTGASQMACGNGHCCVVVSGGKLKCWGRNQFRESNPASSAQTQLLPVEIAGLTGVVAVGTGNYHTCALVADGKLKCWGLATSGQLGDGESEITTKVVDVEGGGYALAVHGGANFTCSVTALSEAWCWGYNGSGQIGNGIGGTSQYAYSPAKVIGQADVKALAAGEEHACFLRKSGDVWCWGHATWGELGGGSGNTYYSQPIQAQGFADGKGVSAGSSHTCAVTNAGAVWCWGNNSAGQLGLGTSPMFSKVPVMVPDVDSVAQLAAGEAHTCAVRTDGSVWCWGGNGHGQCGSGGGKAALAPIKAY